MYNNPIAIPMNAQIFIIYALPRNPLKKSSITAVVATASTDEEIVGPLWDRLKNCFSKISRKMAIRNAFDNGTLASNYRGRASSPGIVDD
ncbi:hypothetical protein [Pseudodesulfovibrio karagichevae]|uniref:Uncharacterized protein n=1 Tax=Pseudodesulfovibrio karagichevae TaxID=3239305 RepID=A0ABV4K8U5_9BACT